jgi:flagellar biosynthesis/type III secretory pathway protein FliH
MSAERVIPARAVDVDSIESFPYFAAQYGPGLDLDGDPDDAPVSANFTSPEEEARRLASADQIIFEKMQQAERDAQDVAHRAFEEGFQSGEAEGRIFGESQYKAQLLRLDGTFNELSHTLSLSAQASRDEVLALALALGEYLAGREIQEGVQTLRPLLDSILDAHPFPESPDIPGAAAGLIVLANPRDLEGLGEAARARPGLQLREDEGLSRGSLRIESAMGVLDATVERRKARLLELIQKSREQEGF